MEKLFTIGICLFLNALFAAYEMAFVSISRPELRSAARKGHQTAQKILALKSNPERTLSVIQIGITVVAAFAAPVGGARPTENLKPVFMQSLGLGQASAEVLSVLIAVAPITYLSVVIGELVPKTLAIRMPLRIVLAGAPVLFFADRILSPIVTILEWSTKRILWLFHKRARFKDTTNQETIELDIMSPTHRVLMLNLAGIERRLIKDIMIPWPEVNFINTSDSLEHVKQMVLSSGHTRLPVIEKGHILGILHTKEFMAFKETGETSWPGIVRPALRILPTDSALRALTLMQDKRSHMCIVFSPSGNHLGIVTIEDIIEEIVGDIYDEDDDDNLRRILATRTRYRRGLNPTDLSR